MKRFAILCLISLIGVPVAHSETNLAPGITLLLDDKAAMDLTADLSLYEIPSVVTGKLVSAGSAAASILVNRWASEFATLFPGVKFDLRGGGSPAGMQELLDGKVDLVTFTRPLPAEEIARFKDRFGYEPAQIMVAQDAIGVYVNKKNPVTGLTLAQLDAIYSRNPKRGGGQPEFWGDLGVTGPLANERISRISLSRVHGTYLYFRDYVMQGGDYRLNVRFEIVPSSLVQAVGADDAGIGLTSVMFATARTRFVPVQGSDGVYRLPSYEETVSGRYPLTRPILIVFNRKPDGTMNPVAREFLRFAVTRRGQRIIALAASYPLTVEQQKKALSVIGGGP
jgi:phosphate transport system substrate-binding protein